MSKRFLLVEDNMFVRMQIADTLESMEVEVIEVGSADEAVKVLSDGLDITHLVTDVGLPGKTDGIALAKLVAEFWPSVSIVIATGREMGSDELPSGAALLNKPFGYGALNDAIVRAERLCSERSSGS